MDSDDKFWTRFWAIAICAFVVLVLGCVAMNLKSEYEYGAAIERQIMAGKDPIDVTCAMSSYIGSSSDKRIMCAIRAAKGSAP